MGTARAPRKRLPKRSLNPCGFHQLRLAVPQTYRRRIATLAYFTLQLARPPDGWAQLQELSAQAREASRQLTEEGRRIRFVRAVFVPEDETCIHVYEATSADDVREAARRARLPVENGVGVVGKEQT